MYNVLLSGINNILATGVQGVEPPATPEFMPEAGAAKRSHAEGMDSWLVY